MNTENRQLQKFKQQSVPSCYIRRLEKPADHGLKKKKKKKVYFTKCELVEEAFFLSIKPASIPSPMNYFEHTLEIKGWQ